MRERETDKAASRVVQYSICVVQYSMCGGGCARCLLAGDQCQLCEPESFDFILYTLYLKDLHALSKGQSTFQCPGCLQW